MNRVFRSSDERGAVLVHAALLLLALTAFSALVVDLGVMFVSRGQAQNAADAGALAAATSLAFVNGTNQPLASSSAIAAAGQNLVWGEAPGIEVQFSPGVPCPADASGVGACVRVNVRRTSYQGGGGTPLPTFFANIVGIGEQGTRATATAQFQARAGTADCVKPWAIPDRWSEQTAVWDPMQTFSRYAQPPPSPPAQVPPDIYRPPSPGDDGLDGFRLPRDFGQPLHLTFNLPMAPGPLASGNSLFPVRINALTPYQNAIENNCSASTDNVTPGMTFPGDLSGSASLPATLAGATTLISRDPAATWDPAANGGLGAPSGGCMAAGTCSRSPRLIAVPLFNPDTYDLTRGTAPAFVVTKVVGFWIERIIGAEVFGYLTPYPTVSLTGPLFTEASSFARTVVLIR
jgi:Flp pilus assembly protein TadG